MPPMDANLLIVIVRTVRSIDQETSGKLLMALVFTQQSNQRCATASHSQPRATVSPTASPGTAENGLILVGPP